LRKTYIHFLRLIVFFVSLFAISRLVFIIVNKSQDREFNWPNALPSFLHGMRMDLSVIAYILLPCIVFYIIFLIKPWQWIRRTEKFYLVFITVVIALIIPANVIVYHYWNNLLNYRALTYLSDPKEIFTSFSAMQMIAGIVLLSLFAYFTYLFFKKSYRYFEEVNVSIFRKSVSVIVLVFAAVIMMRGGFQMLPINESLISFSEDNFINQSAANPAWHLFNDIYRAGLFEGNPFAAMPDEVASKRVKDLFYCDADSFPEILTTKKPNIVLLILESFTADIVGALNGEKGISPSMDRLISEGVLFNSIYSSGSRTDQGIVSLLNGWPATPYYSIMRSTDKVKKLPSLPVILRDKGYHTSFFYGGESNFSNLNTYIINQNFEKITDIKSYDESFARGRWGVHDQYVLGDQIEELNSTTQPFFSVLMTLSNHEPFDVPGPVRFPGNSDPDRFRNSAAYTDACLGEYFRKVRGTGWYKNTLFIISADHGHNLPNHQNVYYAISHHIPFFFYGEVIKPEFRGAVVTKTGGHHDLPGTLLPQLGLNADEFQWSKNLLNPTVKSFAYYQIDQVAGWIDSKYWYGYSYDRNKYLARSYDVPSARLDSMKADGQAFVQKLFDAYKSY
jgi:phosphoglycerol transferase MdoB-like AlkP superfamily enzyme